MSVKVRSLLSTFFQEVSPLNKGAARILRTSSSRVSFDRIVQFLNLIFAWRMNKLSLSYPNLLCLISLQDQLNCSLSPLTLPKTDKSSLELFKSISFLTQVVKIRGSGGFWITGSTFGSLTNPVCAKSYTLATTAKSRFGFFAISSVMRSASLYFNEILERSWVRCSLFERIIYSRLSPIDPEIGTPRKASCMAVYSN